MATTSPLTLGSQIPPVSCADHTGETIHLHDYCATGYALVYFYPKADTPGCTKQACSLRDAYSELGDLGIKVLGVSKDTVEAQRDFHAKYNLNFPLLADDNRDVIEAFGVPTHMLVGLAKRQAFLFKDGSLVWHDAKASTSEQANDVIKVVRAAQ